MEFLYKENFKHTLFKDITRINYVEDMPKQLISDYGYTYIMMRYGNIEAFNYLNKKVKIPRVFVKVTGDYFIVKGFSNSSWLSIELPNYLLYNITKIHATKNRNQLINLSLYVEDDLIESLYTALETVQNIDEIAKITDHYLRDYYRDWTIMRPSVEITDYIFNKKGMLTVQELLDTFPYSKRSLERIFAREVGAGPYRFICLVRFNHIIRELEKQDFDSLTSLIEKYDYYDQSHFEKDFKKFLGQSIREYNNNFNPLLTNALAREYVKNNTH